MTASRTVIAGRYVIHGLLESGGMGDVYDAWQNDLSRRVAVKMMRAELMDDPALFLRFRREAEAAASIGHPNIVQILDFRNEPNEQPMLVMEKLEGRSLRDLLAESKTLAPPRAAFIALQVLSALGAAHDANIVHRDVKPANVFILSTFAVRDFVKVLDFGAAKMLEPGAAVPALTALGEVLGTASYMAPEQAKGLQVDGRADLFAVGGILFEAIAGRPPRTLGPAGIIDAATKECLKLRDVVPSLDPRFAAVVDRALALDRDARFPTAKAMADALAPFAPQEVSSVGLIVPEATRGTPQPRAPENPATVMAPPLGFAAPTLLSPQGGSMPPPLVRDATPAPARGTYYPPPTVRRARPPRSSRWALVLLIPVLAILGLVAAVGIFALLVSRGRDKERAFIARAKAVTCEAPSTCSKKINTLGDHFVACTPVRADRFRRGSLLFIDDSHPYPAKYIGTMASGEVRVELVTGSQRDVDQADVLGAYCSP